MIDTMKIYCYFLFTYKLLNKNFKKNPFFTKRGLTKTTESKCKQKKYITCMW